MAIPILSIVGAFLVVFLFAFSLPAIVTGIGLLYFKSWARVFGIVLSAIALLGFPWVTILGIYGLWVLFNKDTERLFAARRFDRLAPARSRQYGTSSACPAQPRICMRVGYERQRGQSRRSSLGRPKLRRMRDVRGPNAGSPRWALHRARDRRPRSREDSTTRARSRGRSEGALARCPRDCRAREGIASHPSAIAVLVAAEQPYFQSDPGWLKLGRQGSAGGAVRTRWVWRGAIPLHGPGAAAALAPRGYLGAGRRQTDTERPHLLVAGGHQTFISGPAGRRKPSRYSGRPNEGNPGRDGADDASAAVRRGVATRHQNPGGVLGRPEAVEKCRGTGRSRTTSEPAAKRDGLTQPSQAPAPISKPAIEGIAVPTAASVSPAPAAAAVANAISADSTSDVAVPAAYTPPVSNSRQEESARIRSVLGRYETAYNHLDAKAAGSVWPGVDQAALGRAFDGLRSQKVSLGLCEITVIGNVGGASCAGKARWEPKIGGGMKPPTATGRSTCARPITVDRSRSSGSGNRPLPHRILERDGRRDGRGQSAIVERPQDLTARAQAYRSRST